MVCEQPRDPVGQSHLADRRADHEAAEHQPERFRLKAGEQHVRRRRAEYRHRGGEQQRGEKFRQQAGGPEQDGDRGKPAGMDQRRGGLGHNGESVE